jgi:two-component system, NarL family, nitrate/nitrite response regulator NarL
MGMKNLEQPIRILVLSSQAMFRDGLSRLLDAEDGFKVVGDSGDEDQAVKLAAELKPDILLFDVNSLQLHSDGSDFQVLRRFVSNAEKMHPILLTTSDDEEQIVEALRFGVRGVVRSDSSLTLLFKCIRSVHEGGYWISHNTTCELIKSLESLNSKLEHWSKLLNYRLSERELQVIKEIVTGSANKDIAQKLSISEQAVKYHLTNIFCKTGISGRMELARFAIRHQLVREA